MKIVQVKNEHDAVRFLQNLCQCQTWAELEFINEEGAQPEGEHPKKKKTNVS